jgi:hypothetical protein
VSLGVLSMLAVPNQFMLLVTQHVSSPKAEINGDEKRNAAT